MESNLLREIISISETAANIARICRQDEHLLRLLTQEKSEDEKNQRFLTDFKTLADVLIQEVVKFHLSSRFPVLRGNIHGEESNTFTNATGESITLNVTSDQASTRNALLIILNGNQAAVESLLVAMYTEPVVPMSERDIDQLPFVGVSEDMYGVWIDPIDSTAEYIKGDLSCALVLIGVYDKSTGSPVLGVVNQPFHEVNEPAGLEPTATSRAAEGTTMSDSAKDVGTINDGDTTNTDDTVVKSVGTIPDSAKDVGTINDGGTTNTNDTGVKSVGTTIPDSAQDVGTINDGGTTNTDDTVVNSVGTTIPDSAKDVETINDAGTTKPDNSSRNAGKNKLWRGKVYWGVCGGEVRQHCKLPRQDFRRETPVIAISSSERCDIRDHLRDSYNLLPLAGAGYKLLSVILNQTDFYLCTKPSTYVWDTLACHAILKSLGGSVVQCQSVEKNTGSVVRGEELRYDMGRCNTEGLLAYRDESEAQRLLEMVQKLIQR